MVLEAVDHELDVVVLGSGAAALTAAVTAAVHGASIGVYEKAPVLGGTSATSGGKVWVAMNDHMAELGVEDSWDDAWAYLRSMGLDRLDEGLATALLRGGREMARFLEDHTPLRWRALPYPDYRPEHPGARTAGRPLDPQPFPFAELGEWAARINLPPLLGIVRVTLAEHLDAGGSPGLEYGGAGGLLGDLFRQRAEGGDHRASGQALVGALLKGCLDRGVEVTVGAPGRRLLLSDDRREVVGVVVEVDGVERRIRARRGVVLATGGFEWDAELRQAFLSGPLIAPLGVPENEGDGLRMALDAGARLGNMGDAWWYPAFRLPGQEVRGRPLYRFCLLERHLPGSIMVNRRGRRFLNEATNYNDAGRVLHQADPIGHGYANLPAWLVFDDRFHAAYSVGGQPPGTYELGLLRSAPSLRELAAAIGVDADGLEATVARFNEGAREGRDPDFHRGESYHDSYNGDPRLPAPYATLGPLEQGPFHAVEVLPGALGTKGGPRTDEHGRVLGRAGGAIPGLYAAGNTMAAVTELFYVGGGGTLGPGMTFAYLAGCDVATRPR